MPFTYQYRRAALTVDCVVFGFDEGALKVLLIRRGIEPYQNRWALPGGFVRPDETLDAAALRELQEETGLSEIYLEQLYTFGGIDRDPRERVISVAYFALVRRADHLPAAATDAAEAAWFEVEKVPSLAFDHAEILRLALERLRGKIRWQPVGFELLPRKFTLTQFQALYEAILGRELDKRNFRKKLLALDLLVPLEEFSTAASRRPAQLFRFDHRKYQALTRKGFIFDL
ncbi:MAG: NUDIX domain-containing protein [Verrucomicrobiota bacterium]